MNSIFPSTKDTSATNQKIMKISHDSHLVNLSSGKRNISHDGHLVILRSGKTKISHGGHLVILRSVKRKISHDGHLVILRSGKKEISHDGHLAILRSGGKKCLKCKSYQASNTCKWCYCGRLFTSYVIMQTARYFWFDTNHIRILK